MKKSCIHCCGTVSRPCHAGESRFTNSFAGGPVGRPAHNVRNESNLDRQHDRRAIALLQLAPEMIEFFLEAARDAGVVGHHDILFVVFSRAASPVVAAG